MPKDQGLYGRARDPDPGRVPGSAVHLPQIRPGRSGVLRQEQAPEEGGGSAPPGAGLPGDLPGGAGGRRPIVRRAKGRGERLCLLLRGRKGLF